MTAKRTGLSATQPIAVVGSQPLGLAELQLGPLRGWPNSRRTGAPNSTAFAQMKQHSSWFPRSGDDSTGPSFVVSREGFGYRLDQVHWDDMRDVGMFSTLADTIAAVRQILTGEMADSSRRSQHSINLLTRVGRVGCGLDVVMLRCTPRQGTVARNIGTSNVLSDDPALAWQWASALRLTGCHDRLRDTRGCMSSSPRCPRWQRPGDVDRHGAADDHAVSDRPGAWPTDLRPDIGSLRPPPSGAGRVGTVHRCQCR